MTTPSVPLLLSTDAFEDFYGEGLGLDRSAFLETYRNDWSWEYAYALRDQGLRPIIYISSYGSTQVAHTDDGIDVRFLGMGNVDVPWRRFPVLGRTPPGRYVQQLANTRSLLPALRAGLVEDRAEALMVQEYWTGRWDVLSRLTVPLFCIDQGMPEKREIKIAKSRTLPRARAVVVQTSAEATKVEHYGGRPVRIPNGVDTDRYSPPIGPRKPREILIVARLLDVQKRISDLLRALAQLDEAWELRILGGGPDEMQLKALAVELGVDARCSFEGFVMDRNTVVAALQTCSVFALPSAYEGLPMALLEAMACGCAVVGSSIPAIADVVEDGRTGLIVGVGDVPALAGAIQRAGERAQELGSAARSSVLEGYSREICGRRLASLIRSASRFWIAPV